MLKTIFFLVNSLTVLFLPTCQTLHWMTRHKPFAYWYQQRLPPANGCINITGWCSPSFLKRANNIKNLVHDRRHLLYTVLKPVCSFCFFYKILNNLFKKGIINFMTQFINTKNSSRFSTLLSDEATSPYETYVCLSFHLLQVHYDPSSLVS